MLNERTGRLQPWRQSTAASPRSGSRQAQMLDLQKRSLHGSSSSLTAGEGRGRSEQSNPQRLNTARQTLQDHVTGTLTTFRHLTDVPSVRLLSKATAHIQKIHLHKPLPRTLLLEQQQQARGAKPWTEPAHSSTALINECGSHVK